MSNAFDDLTREYLKRRFDAFDHDKIGRIPLSDLISLVRICGGTPLEADIESLKAEADYEGRGSVSFDGFCCAMKMAFENMRTMRDLKEAFKGIDPERKGYMSQHDLRYILTTQGERLSTDEMNAFVEEMRSEMDMEGNFILSDVVYKMTPEIFR
ncbi:calmodulin, putative [Trypanosoma brucei gambiense DAL972]|uniref:Calmodulin, putative n=1 Tax=Trypanosoma brucei gambiense (strain MHOM/CI/86/DAL972) TaxID=679716 RepID=D0A7Y5_TRYB9|nr:calmodulin, putative [Trypanosoma brucei gambiense DAL972]CBH17786.1 calmodulin, putative [Trypanosoma brucei gambiense DAL972]|eukprot:XP_011780050.1 calmodulin, putative [Trypanosoma brucei gambiense DAL972]